MLEPPTPAATAAQGERTGACRGRPESPSEYGPIRIAQANDETGGKAVGGGSETASAQRGPSSLPDAGLAGAESALAAPAALTPADTS